MSSLSISDLNLAGKRTLVRVDFNVPFREDGTVRDDTRIVSTIPTLEHILSQGGKPILMSHLGRPKSKPDPKFSLKTVAKHLESVTNWKVKFVPDCVGNDVVQTVNDMQKDKVLLLENLRFYPGEEANDAAFAANLALLGDVYINDAFAVSHRAHASVHAVAYHFPGRAAAGMLLEKEIRYLGEAVANPQHPTIAILGGSKISTKIGIIQNMLHKVDYLLIGGAMAFAFALVKGGKVGNSFVERETLAEAERLLKLPESSKIILPVDSAIATDMESSQVSNCLTDQIPDGFMGLDIGEQAVNQFRDIILKARTIIWNGPMGVFEKDAFAKGTRRIIEAIATATAKGAISVAGGGDSVAALNQFNLTDKLTHVSTGGGASMEYLEGIELPGIRALKDMSGKHA